MCESVVTVNRGTGSSTLALSPGRSSGPGRRTVTAHRPHGAGKRHTQPLLSDAYMFMYPSSFQLVYGRSPPFARQPHRLFASPEDTPLTHPIGEHQVAACRPHGAGCWEAPHSAPSLTHTCSCTRHHSSCCMVDPRRPPVGITGSSTAARPSTPGHPPPHPLTRFHGRYPPRSARRPRMLFDSSSTAARPSTPGHPPPAPQALRYGTHHRRGGGQPSNQSKFAARTSTVNGWHELGPLLPGGGLTIHFHRCWYVLVGRLIDDLVCNYLGRAAAL